MIPEPTTTWRRAGKCRRLVLCSLVFNPTRKYALIDGRCSSRLFEQRLPLASLSGAGYDGGGLCGGQEEAGTVAENTTSSSVRDE